MDISLTAQLKDSTAFMALYEDGDENKEFDGKSLLFYSSANSDLESRYSITNFLLDKGADVLALNEHKENLLHILLSRTNHDLLQTISLCKRLVDAGVSINQFDDKNRVPLQYLINMKYTDDQLEPLYDIWFSQPTICMDVPNAWGKTPIQLAEQLPYRKNLLKRMKEYESK